ncbi:Phytocyanin domain-containing protein [Citrus sinensis]|uniref:Phytocyanin domain-containing protein n=1 Tax=Citrus sinensis TaxID=2711 RepID=A0ACB8IF72_CITSI|nr:Phytocyanin domain-containing protein [Citrus sinensis]
MAFKAAHSLFVILCAASMLTLCSANRGWSYGLNNTYQRPWGHKNESHNSNNTNDHDGPNKIIVGGSDHWRFGFNYSVWAFQNAPFYVNDVLVFKYDAPNDTVFPHSVYQLPNLWSYLRCDLSRAKMIANRWLPYYFACGEHGGLHCREGRMKFMVLPLLRRWHY